MSGQLVAGVGNLVISAVLARVLLPGDYAGFVAFVAGYVLMHTIASSVTAAGGTGNSDAPSAPTVVVPAQPDAEPEPAAADVTACYQTFCGT